MRRVFVRIVGILALSAGAFSVIGATPCFAVGSGQNTARIVIEHESNSATFCLSFEEETITGFQALKRTGVAVVAEDWGAGQLTVCSIGGVGCSYPEQSCWCECSGNQECSFWGYYRAHANSPFEFSPVGAATTQVRDGDVEGWRFGPQTARGGNPPKKRDGKCVRSAGFLVASREPASSPGASGVVPLVAALAAFAGLGGLIIYSRRARVRP
jgi:hypothetical protein